MLYICFNILTTTFLLYIAISSNIGFQKRTFFSLLLATIFLFGFIISFNFLINLEDSLYVNQLSTYTLVRYIIFILIICIGLSYFLLKKYKSFYSTTIEYFSSSIMYEDLRLLINEFNPHILINISNRIINQIRNNKSKRIMYITIYITLKVIIPCLSTYIFFNFVFLNGDLRYMIFILPFSFIAYLSSFYLYWLEQFSIKNMEYGHKIMQVSLNDDTKSLIKPGDLFISVSAKSLCVFITAFGVSQGYIKDQIPLLTENWITLAHFMYVWNYYKNMTYYINIIIMIVRITCYLYIIYIYI